MFEHDTALLNTPNIFVDTISDDSNVHTLRACGEGLDLYIPMVGSVFSIPGSFRDYDIRATLSEDIVPILMVMIYLLPSWGCSRDQKNKRTTCQHRRQNVVIKPSRNPFHIGGQGFIMLSTTGPPMKKILNDTFSI